jgi:hypothetical protein
MSQSNDFHNNPTHAILHNSFHACFLFSHYIYVWYYMIYVAPWGQWGIDNDNNKSANTTTNIQINSRNNLIYRSQKQMCKEYKSKTAGEGFAARLLRDVMWRFGLNDKYKGGAHVIGLYMRDQIFIWWEFVFKVHFCSGNRKYSQEGVQIEIVKSGGPQK